MLDLKDLVHQIHVLIDADWVVILHALGRGRAPKRWIRTAQAWSKLVEHVTVLAPQTYEQLMSCPCTLPGGQRHAIPF